LCPLVRMVLLQCSLVVNDRPGLFRVRPNDSHNRSCPAARRPPWRCHRPRSLCRRMIRDFPCQVSEGSTNITRSGSKGCCGTSRARGSSPVHQVVSHWCLSCVTSIYTARKIKCSDRLSEFVDRPRRNCEEEGRVLQPTDKLLEMVRNMNVHNRHRAMMGTAL